MGECPVCLRDQCDREHRECSPPRPLECVLYGNPLRERAPEGLCGFCVEEMTGRKVAA